jgi:pimeloyl-ACP methyl ester carboxylesterase
MPLRTLDVQTRSGRLRVTDSGGTGVPIIMLHGSGASRLVFDPQFTSPLLSRFRLIAPDLPGHGESDDAGDAAHYALPGFAAAMEEMLVALDVEQAVLFGWSLGGHIGIEMVGRGNAHILGLMVCGAPPAAPGPIGMLRGFRTNLDLLLATRAQFNAADVQRFYEICYGASGDPRFLDSIRRCDPRVRPAVAASLRRGTGHDQRQVVESTELPLAIVNGIDEPFARLSYVAGLRYRHLWGEVCHIVPDAGHAPFRDQPDVFNDLLVRFATDAATQATERPPVAATARETPRTAMPMLRNA